MPINMSIEYPALEAKCQNMRQTLLFFEGHFAYEVAKDKTNRLAKQHLKIIRESLQKNKQ